MRRQGMAIATDPPKVTVIRLSRVMETHRAMATEMDREVATEMDREMATEIDLAMAWSKGQLRV